MKLRKCLSVYSFLLNKHFSFRIYSYRYDKRLERRTFEENYPSWEIRRTYWRGTCSCVSFRIAVCYRACSGGGWGITAQNVIYRLFSYSGYRTKGTLWLLIRQSYLCGWHLLIRSIHAINVNFYLYMYISEKEQGVIRCALLMICTL